MESAISRIPHGLSIANLANTISRPQHSFQSGNMVQSKGILKSQDHPLFNPVDMKTAPREILFKPVNLNMALPNKSIRPVAMVKPLPVALVKPNKREESLSKADGKNGNEPKQAKANGATEEASNNAPLQNGIKQKNEERSEIDVKSSLMVAIPDNQCRDCLKVMTTKRSVQRRVANWT